MPHQHIRPTIHLSTPIAQVLRRIDVVPGHVSAHFVYAAEAISADPAFDRRRRVRNHVALQAVGGGEVFLAGGTAVGWGGGCGGDVGRGCGGGVGSHGVGFWETVVTRVRGDVTVARSVRGVLLRNGLNS